MKKILLAVISLAAIGAGIYLYLTYKQQQSPRESLSNEELLKGTWKWDHQTPVTDTPQQHPLLTFDNKGLMLRCLSDSAQNDTATYTWTSGNRLSWQFEKNDSLLYKYTVKFLSADSLVLQAADSVTTCYFKKISGLLPK